MREGLEPMLAVQKTQAVHISQWMELPRWNFLIDSCVILWTQQTCHK